MRYRSNPYIYSAASDAGISPRRSTWRLLFSVLYVIMLNVHRSYSVLIHCQVSGHGVQIKDTNGDEDDGLDECSVLCLLGMHMTNGISI
jgi:hypothetical protein